MTTPTDRSFLFRVAEGAAQHIADRLAQKKTDEILLYKNILDGTLDILLEDENADARE